MIRLIDERIMEKLRDKPENIDLEEFVPLVLEWREELLGICFWREGFEAAFGPDRMGEKGG